MSPFTWTEAMSVGQPTLDSDHRCLIRIINLLNAAEGDDAAGVVDTVLDTLEVYCRYHFSREEGIMKAYGFPGLDLHRDEHRDFTTFIQELRRQHAEAQSVTPPELMQTLIDWLLHHVLIQDMAYKPYIQNSDCAAENERLPLASLEMVAQPLSALSQ